MAFSDPEGLAQVRRQYDTPGFDVADADPDPVEQFARWFAPVRAAFPDQPNAMVLATAGRHGRPSVRTVLLKEVDERGGLVWFTNYDSAKGRDLAENPWAEIAFLWLEFHRQVRVAGTVERVADQVSDDYFATRPRGAQIGAWASPQSRVLADRAELEQRTAEVEARFGHDPIPRPPHWGGYRLQPESWEFWQGRIDRLHDRLRYGRAEGRWAIERLAP